MAEAGSETYGICQSPFLIDSFKVVRYILKVKLIGNDRMEYEQDTQMQIEGRGLMHHTDANQFKRVS